MAVLGGSGLGSGLLELLGLDFDFLGPPWLGSGLLEPLDWILPPGDLLGGPPQMVINDFHLQFVTSSHQRLINTELIIGCCVVAGATSTSVSALASQTSVRSYSVTSYQHQHCQQQRSIMTNIKIDNATAMEPLQAALRCARYVPFLCSPLKHVPFLGKSGWNSSRYALWPTRTGEPLSLYPVDDSVDSGAYQHNRTSTRTLKALINAPFLGSVLEWLAYLARCFPRVDGGSFLAVFFISFRFKNSTFPSISRRTRFWSPCCYTLPRVRRA